MYMYENLRGRALQPPRTPHDAPLNRNDQRIPRVPYPPRDRSAVLPEPGTLCGASSVEPGRDDADVRVTGRGIGQRPRATQTGHRVTV